MATKLLLPTEVIDGSHPVSLTIRPQRVVYLVDPSSSATALEAIESACLTWGGIHNFLIPCRPNERPSTMWTEISERFDPDVIVDYVQAEPDYIAHQEKCGRIVRQPGATNHHLTIEGAVIWGALRKREERRSPTKEEIAWTFQASGSHGYELPLAFRYGRTTDRSVGKEMAIGESHRSGHLGEFVRLAADDPSQIDPDELQAILTSYSFAAQYSSLKLEKSEAGYQTLPELTRHGLPSADPPQYLTDVSHPEHRQAQEAFRHSIVIVGAIDSVDDLCLAWNIRATRPKSTFFPVWIAPDWIGNSQLILSILREAKFRQSHQRSEPISLLSASITSDELEALILPEFPNIVETFDASSIGRFFSKRFKIGISQETVGAFRNGRADVPTPSYDQLGIWHFTDSLGWAVSVDGFQTPYVPGIAVPEIGPMPLRRAIDGISGFISPSFPAPDELWAVGTKSGWAVVTDMAEAVGYRAAISDKGKLAIAVMELFGGTVGLRVLASSSVYHLLIGMAETVQRQAIQREVSRSLDRLQIKLPGGASSTEVLVDSIWQNVTSGAQFDRQHFSTSKIKNKLEKFHSIPQQLAFRLIEWLVEHRILFQGYRFQCARCLLQRWYPIGQLSDVQLCDGCQTSTRKPITVDNLNWQYRLNETVAHSVDQGVLPHLLAVSAMAEWESDKRAPLCGVLPGVLFTPVEGSELPEIEVDVLAIKGGYPIIGECKQSRGRFDEGTVGRLSELGRLLHCSRIIYAAVDMSDEDRFAIAATQQDGSVHVESWDQDHLLDRSAYNRVPDASAYLRRALDFAP